MIALAAAIRDYWHAVERDLLDLGYHADDIGVKLTTCELVSIVLAAPTGSALYLVDPMRWSKTDELLANFSEQQAGLVSLNARYTRPQVDSAPPSRPPSEFDSLPNYKGIQFDSAPAEEWHSKLKALQRERREANQ